MGYATYLEQLLAPLGIYTFHSGSISKSELESIGLMLDGCAAQMEETEREALVPTAEDWGLDKIEDAVCEKAGGAHAGPAPCGHCSANTDRRR